MTYFLRYVLDHCGNLLLTGSEMPFEPPGSSIRRKPGTRSVALRKP